MPEGLNPTGSTQSSERRSKIYEICCQYHICLIEHSPSALLRYPSSSSSRASSPASSPSSSDTLPPSEFLSSLPSSYLALDVKGRVLRVDSFAQTPTGSDIGYVTAHKAFIERFVRHQEVSTGGPSAVAQAALLDALVGQEGTKEFSVEGWVEQCAQMSEKAQSKRDILCSSLAALATSAGGKISFSAPENGVFVAVNVHLDGHPRLSSNEKTLKQLAEELCGGSTLVVPGGWFGVDAETQERANFVVSDGWEDNSSVMVS